MNRSLRAYEVGLAATRQATTPSLSRPAVKHTKTTNVITKRALSTSTTAASSNASIRFHTNGSFSITYPKSCTTSSLRSFFTTPRSTFARLTIFRAASTTASPSSPSPSNAPTTARPSQLLEWSTFFNLRKSRRRYSLLSSVITSTTTAATASYLLAETSLFDTVTSVSPIPDPFLTLGVAVVLSGTIGWLLGPVFGLSLWRFSNRSQLPGFLVREKDFYERVKRYRVDPRGASAQNPVPDYYGEKVGSRQEWRTWLKDQRVFNRKREGRGTGVGGGLGFAGKGVSR